MRRLKEGENDGGRSELNMRRVSYFYSNICIYHVVM